MEIIIESGFIKADEIKSGDKFKIVSDVREMPNKFNPERPRLVVSLEDKEGSIKTCGLNRSSQKNLVKAFGKESEDWLGKEIILKTVSTLVSGEMRDVIIADAS